MMGRRSRMLLLFGLALVFTVGLTFATVELPYLVDGWLQSTIPTPGFDSHADDTRRLKAELFMAHYHLRAIGYVGFFLLVGLVVAGFVTQRRQLASAGAIGFMLAVFAQFAGVMFFLAGLGLLNVLWLPVLDFPIDLSQLGLLVRAPYDFLRWLLRWMGLPSYWPLVVASVGGGALLFLVGTHAWLATRTGGESVADRLVYRISRHPQYLGWILWSYGCYMLLQQGLYPRRSWGIDAGLPWLISTLVILGVALLEELDMRRKFGEAYERYLRSSPFLLPLPRLLRLVFPVPVRLLFRKSWPERRREVAVLVGTWAFLLMTVSALTYGGGLDRITRSLSSPERRAAAVQDLADRIVVEPNWRRQESLARELASWGETAVPVLAGLLAEENTMVRRIAADRLGGLPSDDAVSALVRALADSAEDVRGRAVVALGSIGSPRCIEVLRGMLDDSSETVRIAALDVLSRFRSADALPVALQLLESPDVWKRIAAVHAVGWIGSDVAVQALASRLGDERPEVRRDVVIALLRLGEPAVRPLLDRATSDPDREVRVYATEALKRIPARGP